jgi:hypothetical protein
MTIYPIPTFRDLTIRYILGSHTANVYLYGREVDCFTFAWEKDRTNFADFFRRPMPTCRLLTST